MDVGQGEVSLCQVGLQADGFISSGSGLLKHSKIRCIIVKQGFHVAELRESECKGRVQLGSLLIKLRHLLDLFL